MTKTIAGAVLTAALVGGSITAIMVHPHLAVADSAAVINQRSLKTAFDHSYCQQACHAQCGYNSDGSVNGGVNALFRANACYQRCYPQCRAG
jgi:hypothetical protein